MPLETHIGMELGKIRFTNTLGRTVQDFVPLSESQVTMYNCGPTVYSRAHIGNLRAYVFADVVRRTLEYAGYNVKQVMNITDVGHLTSDADQGDDKVQKAAREQRVTAWDIAKANTEQFFEDTAKLNILTPHIVCKATDHIQEQIDLVKRLEVKGYTYRTDDGIYFDTSKFPEYGKMAQLNVEGLNAGQRIEMGGKRNKTDFALWKFSKEGEKRDMEWESPWGKGFPGWHIECSAMAMKYLGETIDIHTGGIDHIPIHHTNEIAQAEAATGKQFARYWLHNDFIVFTDNRKMSKSLGNVVNIGTLEDRGITPLAYRYICLGTHYRKGISFGEETLKFGVSSYDRLKTKVLDLKSQVSSVGKVALGSAPSNYVSDFRNSIFNDLNTPQALATIWNILDDELIVPNEKYSTLVEFDKVLGLGISSFKPDSLDIDERVSKLVEERRIARRNRDWKRSDEIRRELEKEGLSVNDTPQGPVIRKISL